MHGPPDARGLAVPRLNGRLLLDEPTAHLDFSRQFRFPDILQQMGIIYHIPVGIYHVSEAQRDVCLPEP